MPSSEPRTAIAPARRYLPRLIGLAVGVALLLIANAGNNNLLDYAQDILQQCGIAIIMAVSLNIVNGLTGQFAIGHAGFMAVGAYTGASVTFFAAQKLAHGGAPGMGWMLAAMAAGGLMAAVFGCIVGVPSLRLRGDYLAIVTLGFGEIIRVLLENAHDISPSLDYMGGATGFQNVPVGLATFPLLWATVAAVVLLTRNLKFSSHGLAFMSVREDEIAADAMGVNTTRIKVTAFVLSAFFAGVGGVLFAHAKFFQPKTFNFILSINYVVMIVLGGTGSITGATLAAVVLTALPEFLKPVKERIHFTDEYRQVLYALLLVLMMILRPAGVFGMGELSLSGLRRWLRRRGSPITGVPEGLTEEGRRAAEDVAPQLEDDSTQDTKEYEGKTVPEPRHERATAPSLARVTPNPDTRTDTALDMVHLTRRFGGLTAVGDVTIRLNEGELVGLIGPNGAGKTTLFNLLTGVYEPSQGQIDFGGRPLAGERPYPQAQRLLLLALDTLLTALGGWIVGTIVASAIVPYAATPEALRMQAGVRLLCVAVAAGWSLATAPRRRRRRPGLKPYQFAQRGISRTFQNIRLFGELTVLENVRIGTYLRRHTNLFDALFRTARLEREEAASIEKARELLARFNLLRVQDEKARNLPYGDQRRLEIVRALATEPKLLLLDEPAAGMNPQEKVSLMNLIRQIRDDFGLTVLLIEHDMMLVMGICERIYVLDYGRVIAEGTPAEIRSDPTVIAAYLGEELGDADADGIPDGQQRKMVQDQ
jgi:branched-chain amino acid transport system permease protein